MQLHGALGAAGLLSLGLLPQLAHAQQQTADTDVYLPPPASNGSIPTDESILANPSQTANPQYSNLLGNLHWLYEAQRTGKLPADNRVPWRNDTLLDDGMALSGVNLSQGYFDAGNFILATYPLSWTLESLAWGGLLYGRAYNLTDQGRYLDRTLRWGLDWMLKASNTTDTLWVQVGTVANAYWGSDLGIPAPRPAYQVNRTAPGTDAFASAASAFAAGSLFYSGRTLPVNSSSPADLVNRTQLPSQRDAAYARTLLDRAVAMWNVATTAQPMQVYQTAVPQANDAYPSSDYHDKLVMSSLWLAMATGNSSYAASAAQFYDQMLSSPNLPNANRQLGGPLNWDQKSPATAMLFLHAAQFNAQLGINASRFEADMETYLDRLIAPSLPKTFFTDGNAAQSERLLWFTDYSGTASLNPALNAAFLLQLYSGYTSDAGKAQRYRQVADAQLDYALGKNPMRTVYVCGQHPNSYVNPHSSLASGGSGFGFINTQPPQERYVLYGGVPGGPSSGDLFYDLRDDYDQTEVALDYNAPMINLVAGRIQYQAWTPPPPPGRNASDGGPLGDPFYVSLQPGSRIVPVCSGSACNSAGSVLPASALTLSLSVALVVGAAIFA